MGVKVFTDFPGGNGHVLQTARDAAGDVVWFRPENKGLEPKALWFHFRVEGVKGPRLRCVLANPAQTLGPVQDWAMNKPVYREVGGEWRRVDSVQLRSNESAVPEATWSIPTEADVVEVAFCYPYQHADLKNTLEKTSRWATGVIGYTSGGRPIKRLSTDVGGEARGPTRPGVFILARQHAGETSGSWVLDGLLRYLDSPTGESLCETAGWWVIPFVDVDGVAEGYYGKDRPPCDLNRAWQFPFPGRCEVDAIQHDMWRWKERFRPSVVIDIHSPAHSETGFYFNVVAASTHESYRPLALRLAEAYYKKAPPPLRGAFPYVENSRTSAQAGGDTVSHFAMKHLGCTGTVMEVAYQGYDIQDYRKLGAVLAQTVHDVVVRDQA